MKNLLIVFCGITSTLVAQIPTITDFTPKSGPVGTVVTITGSNFNSIAANNLVFVGDLKGNVLSSNTTTIQFAVPVGTAYSYIRLTDTTTGLSSKSHTPFIVTFANGDPLSDSSFANKVDISLVGAWHGISLGDVDGNGKIDLSTTTSIYKNSSAPNSIIFGPPISFTTDIIHHGQSAADVNGDGAPDIVLTNYNNNTVNIFKNNCSGTTIDFIQQTDLSTNNNPKGVGVEDIDGDGKLDIAVGYFGATVSLFRNTSSVNTVSFSLKIDFPFGSEGGVYLCDLDKDGKAELIILNHNSNSISVYRNTSVIGSISFADKIDYVTGAYPNGIAFGDIDGDSKIDMCVGNYNSGSISIYLNNCVPGTINFESKKDFNTGNNPNQIGIGDFNGDGKNDLAISRTYADKISILSNMSENDTVKFSTFYEYAVGPNPAKILTADLDVDGKIDVAVSNGNNNSLSVLRNTANQFSLPVPPQNLVSIAGNQQITLRWNKATSSYILRYRIYGGTSANPTTKIDSTETLNDTTKIITSLTNGQIYYYRVTAVDTAGQESGFSNEVNATPGNSSPVAVDLQDTLIISTTRQRTVSLTFNSAGSNDSDGTIDSVLWYVNGRFKYSGTSFTYNYGPGTNDVMLIVKDNDGESDTSTATVTKLFFREILNGPIYSPISLHDDNTVYAVASGDAVYKYNISGILDYYLEVGFGDTRSASVGSDGAVYIASENTNSLYAFSKTGTSVWPALALGAKASASPTVDNNGSRLYIGVANRNFQSVNKNTGSVMWNFFSDAPIRHSAVLTKDKRLIFSTIKGTVYGVNINENHTSPTWSLPVGDSINTSPAIDYQGYFYFGTTGGKVIKVKMKSGYTPSIIWQSSFGSQMTSSPVIDARGNLYIGTQDGRLLSIKSLDGDLKWNVSTSGAVRSTASISPKGLIYFGNDAKTFYAVDSLGAIQWLYRDSSAITAPSLFYNGVVYFGNNTGHFTAIYDADSLSPGGMRKFARTTEDLSIPIWGTYQGDNQRTGVQTIDETVPVELISFTGICKNGMVELKWNTATESNNAGFEVLRKESKEVDFKMMSFVTGGGNSNAPMSYQYIDTVGVSGVYMYLLKQIDRDGREKYSNSIEIQISIVPTEYSLSQNYPNPFNPATTIRYGLPASSRVSIMVYNALGQQVADLVNTEQSAGWYEAVWNANIASGIYFYRIEAVSSTDPNRRFTQFKKMLLLK